MEAIADTTEYIFENFGRKSSLKFIEKIKQAAAMLIKNPNIGKIEPDLDDMAATYRSFLATKINKLIYRVMMTAIFMCRFFGIVAATRQHCQIW